jgi:hypothetical protein
VMVLVTLGVGRWVNPLVLTYLVALGYVVLGVIEGRESLPAEVEEQGASEDAGEENGGHSKDPGPSSE